VKFNQISHETKEKIFYGEKWGGGVARLGSGNLGEKI
jgi:hypothetical protein